MFADGQTDQFGPPSTRRAMHASDQILNEPLLLTSASERVLSPTDSAIRNAAAILNDGGLVALPTETVYGLGADAENETALAAIFAAKGRPADHPLIIHLACAQLMTDYGRDIPDLAWRLAERFWPGPLTLIVKRRSGVPDLVTGGQDTVGLRVPVHPVAQRLLKCFGRGIAAPSANRFGRISPTQAAHVVSELGERVGCILDGGACSVGIESTILDLSGSEPRLLRPGSIGAHALARELGVEPSRGSTGAPRVSGSLPSHYAPATPVRLVDSADLIELAMPGQESLGVMAFQSTMTTREQVHWLTMPADAQDYGRQLFSRLRELDEEGHACIYMERPPVGADWDAVHDRLTRAALPGGSRKRVSRINQGKSMKYLLLLRSFALLEGGRGDLNALLSRLPAGEPSEDQVLGMWIDPALATDPAPLLEESEITVAETVGLPGHWLVCGFESAAEDISRAELLEFLKRTARDRSGYGQFIPVYPESRKRDDLVADLEQLSATGGRLMGEPWFQEKTGQLRRSTDRPLS